MVATGAVNPAAAYQFPSGHLGHLSADQQTAFDKFKQLCTERKAYAPSGSGPTGDLPSTSDAVLLRFLRARKFDLEGAYKQFKETEEWRRENDIEGVYRWIDRQEYEETRRLYPQWTGRRDKRGLPVYVFQVGNLSSKDITAYEQTPRLRNAPKSHTSPTPAKLLRLFALYENLTSFALPFCTAAADRPYAGVTPVTQSNNIVDITGVGLKQFWDLKAHLQDASTLATAHYPETLDRIFIIGSPSFFPTIWSWVKRWFDPIVVSKMFILSEKDVLPTLSEFIEVQDIPKKYGGGLDYEFGQMPNLGTDGMGGMVEWAEGRPKGQLPTGTIAWERSEDGEMIMVNSGSVDGVEKREVIGTVKSSWADALLPGRPKRNEVKEAGRANGDHATLNGDQVEKGEVGSSGESLSVPSLPTSAGPPVVA